MPPPLPEQEWLLNGCFVDHFVVCRDSQPARIVAPVLRRFALQNLWMAEQPKRNSSKRPINRIHAAILLEAAAQTMLQYLLDDNFEAGLPGDLAPLFDRWKQSRLN